MKDIRLNVSTDGSGDGTATSTESIMGEVFAVEWIDGDLTDGVDAVLSVVNSTSGIDRTILTLTNADADAFYHLSAAAYTAAGAAVTDSHVAPFVNGQLKLTVSSGGSAKSGGAIAYVR